MRYNENTKITPNKHKQYRILVVYVLADVYDDDESWVAKPYTNNPADISGQNTHERIR